ncbi:TPA: hypothetical protein MYP23_005070 [Klebsiella quasipneumoniae]|nr:hypothetical protein [Klebsiella quasipneumoniae]
MPMIGGVLYLPESEIRTYELQEFGFNDGGSYEEFDGSTEGKKANINIRKYISETYGPMIDKAAEDKEVEYIEKRASISEAIYNEVEAEKLNNPVSGLNTSESLIYEASIRESLAAQKTMELPILKSTADSFYLDDFFNYQITAFFVRAYGRELGRISDTGDTYQAWLDSLNAAYVRIPRHSDTQPTLIRTPVPRSFGQAVGAQRRRGGIVSPGWLASSISASVCALIHPSD